MHTHTHIDTHHYKCSGLDVRWMDGWLPSWVARGAFQPSSLPSFPPVSPANCVNGKATEAFANFAATAQGYNSTGYYINVSISISKRWPCIVLQLRARWSSKMAKRTEQKRISETKSTKQQESFLEYTFWHKQWEHLGQKQADVAVQLSCSLRKSSLKVSSSLLFLIKFRKYNKLNHQVLILETLS